MAAESEKVSMKSSPNLIFVTADGDAVIFFIRPSSTKARLRPLIERAGGLVTSRISGREDVIRIAADDDIVTADGYVRAKFVDDCLETGQLLDTKDYSCMQTGQSKAVANQGTSYVMENVSVLGRMKYTEEEDRSILEYVAKHPNNYAGNAMWKKMELMRITYHSWQSMRDHFLKHLEDRLPEYIALEKEKQQDLIESKRRDTEEEEEEENGQTKRQRSDEELDRSSLKLREGYIYEFLRNMKDPSEDVEQEDPSDHIENQIIALVKAWSKKYNMSKKAIAVALYINSGDLDHTEQLLDNRALHPGVGVCTSHGEYILDTCYEDVRLWTNEDDKLLMKNEKYDELCQRYGESSVRKRKEFLTP